MIVAKNQTVYMAIPSPPLNYESRGIGILKRDLVKLNKNKINGPSFKIVKNFMIFFY